MKEPLVSIIIPTFNNEEYILDAVNSALGQTYKRTEIIVIDDGSTDRTREKLDLYIKAGKVKYIYQKNRGLASARNKGINSSSGEYTALLDADDLFKPEKIEKQLRFLTSNPSCDFCFCDVILFEEGRLGKLFKYDYEYHSGHVFKYLIQRNFINPSTLFFNKDNVVSRFGLFKESLRRAEDLEYFLRVSLGGARFCFLNEPLFISRLRKGSSLQADRVLVQETTFEVLKEVGEKLTAAEKKLYNFSEVLDARAVKLALVYLAAGQRNLARKTILGIRRRYPTKGLLLVISLMPTLLTNNLVRFLTTIRRWVLFKKKIRS